MPGVYPYNSMMGDMLLNCGCIKIGIRHEKDKTSKEKQDIKFENCKKNEKMVLKRVLGKLKEYQAIKVEPPARKYLKELAL